MQKLFCLKVILSLLALSFVSLADVECGITLRDTKEKFTVFKEGSAASSIREEDDGSVSWIATAAGGGGGGAAFYVKSDKKEINIANYESIDIEFEVVELKVLLIEEWLVAKLKNLFLPL